jgi:hypothetical protein
MYVAYDRDADGDISCAFAASSRYAAARKYARQRSSFARTRGSEFGPTVRPASEAPAAARRAADGLRLGGDA